MRTLIVAGCSLTQNVDGNVILNEFGFGGSAHVADINRVITDVAARILDVSKGELMLSAIADVCIAGLPIGGRGTSGVLIYYFVVNEYIEYIRTRLCARVEVKRQHLVFVEGNIGIDDSIRTCAVCIGSLYACIIRTDDPRPSIFILILPTIGDFAVYGGVVHSICNVLHGRIFNVGMFKFKVIADILNIVVTGVPFKPIYKGVCI